MSRKTTRAPATEEPATKQVKPLARLGNEATKLTRSDWIAGRWVALLLFIATLGGAAACSQLGRRTKAIEARRVLLISMDTCRADRLSCYGFRRNTTPHIDAVARDGTLFTHAFSPVPMTLPAHSTMLTGTIPPYHGVHDNLGYTLSEKNVTLSMMLKDQGFATGAVVGAFVLSAFTGIDRGFDTYDDDFEEYLSAILHTERRGAHVSRLAIDWLEKHQNDPFFLFVHYYDPHASYEPPEPFASRFAQDPYSGEIAYTDHCVGQVIQKLKDLGIYDSTLIVITSDHGELLGEHGEPTHAYFIYQNALRVPLIVKPPMRPGSAAKQHQPRTIDSIVGLVDIVPTICGLVGIASPAAVRGVDLSGSLVGEPPPVADRHLYCESLAATKYKANSLLGLVTRNWKYIQTTRPELYDLANDPAEAHNLAQVKVHEAKVLKDQLRQILDSQVRNLVDSTATASDQTIQRMQALGYLSGDVSEDFEFEQTKLDPKDLIDVHISYSLVSNYLARAEYDQALGKCQELLDKWPDFVPGIVIMARVQLEMQQPLAALEYATRAMVLDKAHHRPPYTRGLILAALDRTAEAITHFEQALKANDAPFPNAHTALGQALETQGKTQDAIQHYRKALEISPKSSDAHCNLGNALSSLGQHDDAINHYRKALQFNPRFANAHFNLGNALSRLGQHEEARDRYKRVIALKPDLAEAHYNLALESGRLERHGDAIAAFESYLHLEPTNAKAHLNLGVACQHAARPTAALAAFQRALELDGDGTIGSKASRYIQLLQGATSGNGQRH